jgi:ubiquinone/menaquinone biosynthesis C-methylase UbiE
MNEQLNSAEDAIQRFSTREAAQKYNQALVGTRKHTREMKALEIAVRGIPRDSRVLDFPCGTGRLNSLLEEKGYQVTAVDSSYHMAAIARQNRGSSADQSPGYAVSDVLKTAFCDDAFDAVICNRLFHHFYEKDIRRTALSELARISKGPVVISYYSTHCLDAVTFRIKNGLRGRKPTDRVPIPPSVLAEDARASGLNVVREIRSRSIVSMQTYAVLEPL